MNVRDRPGAEPWAARPRARAPRCRAWIESLDRDIYLSTLRGEVTTARTGRRQSTRKKSQLAARLALHGPHSAQAGVGSTSTASRATSAGGGAAPRSRKASACGTGSTAAGSCNGVPARPPSCST